MQVRQMLILTRLKPNYTDNNSNNNATTNNTNRSNNINKWLENFDERSHRGSSLY